MRFIIIASTITYTVCYQFGKILWAAVFRFLKFLASRRKAKDQP